nr:hypothetical protein CFP56_19239 [Quercus suber]
MLDISRMLEQRIMATSITNENSPESGDHARTVAVVHRLGWALDPEGAVLPGQGPVFVPKLHYDSKTCRLGNGIHEKDVEVYASSPRWTAVAFTVSLTPIADDMDMCRHFTLATLDDLGYHSLRQGCSMEITYLDREYTAPSTSCWESGTTTSVVADTCCPRERRWVWSCRIGLVPRSISLSWRRNGASWVVVLPGSRAGFELVHRTASRLRAIGSADLGASVSPIEATDQMSRSRESRVRLSYADLPAHAAGLSQRKDRRAANRISIRTERLQCSIDICFAELLSLTRRVF